MAQTQKHVCHVSQYSYEKLSSITEHFLAGILLFLNTSIFLLQYKLE